LNDALICFAVNSLPCSNAPRSLAVLLIYTLHNIAIIIKRIQL